jgi:hypothetical protein
MAMEKLIKDRYSIEEASTLLSQGDPNKKQSIRDHLGAIHALEIAKFLLDNCLGDYGKTGWNLALYLFTISREEVMRHDEELKRENKEISGSMAKKRGRPKNRSEREKEIEIALASYTGKEYPRSRLIDLVAEKLGMSPGTLTRWYKECFSHKKK